MKLNDIGPSQMFPEEALANQYFQLVALLCNEVGEHSGFSNIEEIRTGSLLTSGSFSPIITVITRTQGKRNAALEEMLLGLAAQTDMRFVIRLVGHNLDSNARDNLLVLIDNCPAWIQDRISFISVTGGGRSRPLNAALEQIETPYFVILDDDDLIFDNWIESFALAFEKHSGRIIHSGVFVQEWESICSDGRVINRAVSSPDFYFCTPYNPVRQFQTNFCPIMGLAYPSFVVNMLGLRFDESLTTLEDWDFLMRAAVFCGVEESGENTAIYRYWKNVASSHDLHDDDEWELNRIRIKEKLNSIPILLPAGTVDQLTDFAKIDQEVEMPTHYARIELHTAKGEFFLISPSVVDYDPKTFINTLKFDFPENCKPTKIEFSPIDSGQVTMIDFSLTLVFEDGTTDVLSRNDLVGNGYNPTPNEWAFIYAPMISCKLAGNKIVKSCTMRFKFNNTVPVDVLTGTKLVMRTKSSIRRRAHKLKKVLGGRKRTS